MYSDSQTVIIRAEDLRRLHEEIDWLRDVLPSTVLPVSRYAVARLLEPHVSADDIYEATDAVKAAMDKLVADFKLSRNAKQLREALPDPERLEAFARQFNGMRKPPRGVINWDAEADELRAMAEKIRGVRG